MNRPWAPQKNPTATRSTGELKVMSFGEHLEELRSRIIRSLLVTFAISIVALIYQQPLMRAISGPHRTAMAQVQGRRLAIDLEKRLGELRQSLLEIPWREGGAALAEEERIGQLWSELATLAEARADEPLAAGILAVLDAERAEIVTGETISGALLLIAANLVRAGEDHAWGALSDIEAARGHLEGIEEMIGFWRAEAANPSEGAPASADRARAALVKFSEDLGELTEVSRRLVKWNDETTPLKLLTYTEAFFSHLKLAFLTGILCGLPWITYEIWLFVSAGLYRKERKSVAPFLPFCLIGIVLGGLFAYNILIPVGLTYLGGYGDPELFDPNFTLTDYMSLVFTLLIGMGLVFQLPLLMIFLSRAGVVTPEQFRRHQKIALILALIMGAFLTPPDVVTQMLMAIPLVLLYEVGIWSSIWFRRRARLRKESSQ